VKRSRLGKKRRKKKGNFSWEEKKEGGEKTIMLSREKGPAVDGGKGRGPSLEEEGDSKKGGVMPLGCEPKGDHSAEKGKKKKKNNRKTRWN